MLIAKRPKIAYSEVTPKADYLNRRAADGRRRRAGGRGDRRDRGPGRSRSSGAPSPYSIDDPPTALEYITSYNNFYEFGSDKDDPAANAGALTTTPWSVAVDGLVDKPGDLRRSTTSSGRTRSRSASTGCAASRAGRW